MLSEGGGGCFYAFFLYMFGGKETLCLITADTFPLQASASTSVPAQFITLSAYS